jgi:hypothetical protein
MSGGGIFPDVDIVADHRRTLHFPVGYSVLGIGVGLVALAVPSTEALLGFVFVGSAAIHCLSDVLAGSVEAEPWKRTTERAVYNHALGLWHRPRRYVRYSGAPEDFALTLGAGAIVMYAPSTRPVSEALILGIVAVSGVFALARHPRTPVTGVAAYTPEMVLARLPRLVVETTETGATTLSIRRR